jgi:hypothetical protein
MKIACMFLFLGWVTSACLQAAVTINLTIRGAYDASASNVAYNTLWAMIIDDGAVDNSLTGISLAGTGGSLINNGTPTVFTSGQTLSVGQSFGSGTVYAMGGFNNNLGVAQASTTHALASLTLGVNGLTAGRSYGIYWFSGATFSGTAGDFTTGAHSQAIGSQVGGIVNLANDASATYGNMAIPTDGSTVSQGARSTGVTWTVSDMSSVNLIPEPSTFLLASLGVLGLLRRRR